MNKLIAKIKSEQSKLETYQLLLTIPTRYEDDYKKVQDKIDMLEYNLARLKGQLNNYGVFAI